MMFVSTRTLLVVYASVIYLCGFVAARTQPCYICGSQNTTITNPFSIIRAGTVSFLPINDLNCAELLYLALDAFENPAFCDEIFTSEIPKICGCTQVDTPASTPVAASAQASDQASIQAPSDESVKRPLNGHTSETSGAFLFCTKDCEFQYRLCKKICGMESSANLVACSKKCKVDFSKNSCYEKCSDNGYVASFASTNTLGSEIIARPGFMSLYQVHPNRETDPNCVDTCTCKYGLTTTCNCVPTCSCTYAPALKANRTVCEGCLYQSDGISISKHSSFYANKDMYSYFLYDSISTGNKSYDVTHFVYDGVLANCELSIDWVNCITCTLIECSDGSLGYKADCTNFVGGEFFNFCTFSEGTNPKGNLLRPLSALNSVNCKVNTTTPSGTLYGNSPKAPVKVPWKAPVKVPWKAPAKVPWKAPAKVPVKTPWKTPVKAPVKAPPVKAPAKAPAKVPVKEPDAVCGFCKVPYECNYILPGLSPNKMCKCPNWDLGLPYFCCNECDFGMICIDDCFWCTCQALPTLPPILFSEGNND